MKNDTMVVKEVDASKEHWFNILEKEIEYTDLSICNNELLQYGKGNYEFELSEEVFGKLLAVTKGQDLSSYVFILAAFKILLYKYNSIEDTVVLSPVLSKCDEYFNQYVLFRDNVNNKNTFKEFLLDVKNTVSSAYKNQKYPVIKLASSLGIEREKLFNNPI
ncbi:condensation domain-containing protein, partial [Clostridium butyricum]